MCVNCTKTRGKWMTKSAVTRKLRGSERASRFGEDFEIESEVTLQNNRLQRPFASLHANKALHLSPAPSIAETGYSRYFHSRRLTDSGLSVACP